MPKHQYHIFVCENRRPAEDPRGCCAAKGAGEIRAFFKEEIKKRGLKGKVRANQAWCLDTCGMGPSVVVYPEAIWYTVKSKEDALEIIDRHLLKGEIVERLLMPASWARG